jgi:predicted acyl esterase
MSTPQRHTEIRTIIRRVSFPSEHDGTKLNARIIYPHDATSPNTTSLPAVVLAHPYGPLGRQRLKNMYPNGLLFIRW